MCGTMIGLSVFLTACLATLAEGSLMETMRRAKRNAPSPEQQDQARAWMYWNLPVDLGVYINNDYVSDYETPVSARAYKRTMQRPSSEGSGSGSGSIETGKRSRVPKPVSKEEHGKPAETFEAETRSELSANVSKPVEEISDDETSKRTTTVTCQGQKEWLQCPTYQLLKVNSAFWGRDDDKTCASYGRKHGMNTHEICAQDERNTISKIENACNGENACELIASPVFFDRTDCPDVYKYIKVDWECAHAESRMIIGEKK